VALQLPYSEHYWDQVALKFLLKNSPWTWARQWTRAPDGGDLNVNTLFSTVRHGTQHHGFKEYRLPVRP
jgi:hypothetical protein